MDFWYSLRVIKIVFSLVAKMCCLTAGPKVMEPSNHGLKPPKYRMEDRTQLTRGGVTSEILRGDSLNIQVF